MESINLSMFVHSAALKAAEFPGAGILADPGPPMTMITRLAFTNATINKGQELAPFLP